MYHLFICYPQVSNILSNPGKVHFEGLIYLLRYIRENKNLGLKYYADMKDAPLSDLLRQASIKIKNQLMAFSDSCWQYTGISTGAYMISYQGGPIDNGTHVTEPVGHSGAENEYNSEYTTGIALAYFRILIHDCFCKDPDIVPEDAPIIILDSKSDVCMAKNDKDTNHTRRISRRLYFVRNGEK